MTTPAATTVPRRLRPVLSWHRPLAVFAATNAVLAMVAVTGLVVDERVLRGEPIWLKPFKFAVSFVLFGFTLAWMISLLRRRRRWGKRLGTVIVAMGVVEMAVIVGQVVRGQQSHFNTTTVFDTGLWTIMGSAIVGLWVATVIVAILLLREPVADRVLMRAIRLGIVVALVGMAMAFFMTAPTADQAQALAAGQTTATGAHSVGVRDGGPGLPVTGWSTTGGDLRAAHFVGMHALQGVPLFALVLGILSARLTRLRDERVRMGLVAVTAAAWLGFALLLLWQALRGQPLLSPDGMTLGALAVLLMGTATATGLVLRTGAAAEADQAVTR